MALSDFIRSQLIDIIEWTDDSRDTLSFRFPGSGQGNQARRATDRPRVSGRAVRLPRRVRRRVPARQAHADHRQHPGPLALKSWKYGFESPFKADVYYVTTRLFTGNKWGTSNPVMMRDQDFGIVRVRAFGTYDFRVVDVKRFLKEVAGTDNHFRLDEFADAMRSRIVSVFSEALATAKVPVLDVATRYSELGEALLPLINPVLTGKYGIEMGSFIVENVSVPPEVEAAIDKRSSMAAVGNLNDYVKFQMAQGLEKGGSGVAGGSGAEMAVGWPSRKQMMNQPGGVGGQTTPAAGAPPPAASAGCPRLMGPADAATVLGVSRSRRHRQPRSRRSQGKEDRHAVAHHAAPPSPSSSSSAARSWTRHRRSETSPPETVATRAVQKYHCPACGAEAHWNPAKQALICPYCGAESPATLEVRGDGDRHRRARSGAGAAQHSRFGARLERREDLGPLSELPGDLGVRCGQGRPAL